MEEKKFKGSVEKEALTDDEFDQILQSATRRGEEARKIILMLRWTGMHVSVLAEPIKYGLHVEHEDDGDYIVWKRTKKQSKEAYTDIKVHSSMNFNVEEFIKELKTRRMANKKRKISRQYFYQVVRGVGERAGIRDLSPMSFRHTFGVWLANNEFPPSFIQQKLNCSSRVLRTYLKRARKIDKSIYERKGW